MRIGLLSDVHGNVVALEAALADLGEVDGYWFLGDLVAHGPRPAECVRRVAGLPGLVAVRGNTDRYVLTQPPDPAMTASFGWTRSQLPPDHLAWLAERPLEARPLDGVLLVHASPGRDDGPGLDPHTPSADLAPAFAAAAADLVVVGHTHHPDDRAVAGIRVVNPGPVSLPRASEAVTHAAVLSRVDAGWEVEHRVTPYDRDEVLDDLRSGDHPSADWLVEKLTTPWGPPAG